MILITPMSSKSEEVFPCTRCGACCRNVSLSPLTAWLDKGDGVCYHLDVETNLCSIYEHRPEICRVDIQYKINYQKDMTWNKFCAINNRYCEILKELTNT